MNKRRLWWLAAGHFLVDLNGGVLPALWPTLQAADQLSYGAIGLLVMAFNLASSLLQPLLGAFSDRGRRAWLLPLALGLAGLGVAALGVVHGFAALAGAALVGGAGVAAYHPEAARTAHHSAGERRAWGMSIFSMGGNGGFAAGPLLATGLLAWLGVRGIALLAVPALAAMVLFWWQMPVLGGSLAASPPTARPGGGATWPTMVTLVVVVTLRALVQTGTLTFFPLYLIHTHQASTGLVGVLLFLFSVAGMAGTYLAGHLADRWGRRPVVVSGLSLAVVFLAVMLRGHGLWLTLLVIPTGAVLVGTFPVTTVLAQELMPANMGVASGLVQGFAWGLAGMSLAVVGLAADRFGLWLVLNALVVVAALAALLACGLPQWAPPALVASAGASPPPSVPG